MGSHNASVEHFHSSMDVLYLHTWSTTPPSYALPNCRKKKKRKSLHLERSQLKREMQKSKEGPFHLQ
jgi:hypothetical protein